MIRRISLPPGIDKESTEFTAEGAWFDSNNIRFRGQFPECIGGWVRQGTISMEGLAREILSRTSDAGDEYNAVGTNWKYYVIFGDTPADITPLRATTAAGAATFGKVGTGDATITVTQSSHGANQYDFVTFSSTASLGGNITAAVLDQEYQISTVASDGNSFTIEAKDPDTGDPVTAAGGDASSGGGGGSTIAKYQISVGLAADASGTGWGLDGWGSGGWGEAASVSTITGRFRTPMIQGYGESLMLCNSGGPIYFWDYGTSVSSGAPVETDAVHAAELNTFSGSSDTPTIVNDFLVSSRDGHCIAFGCNDIGSSTVNNLLVRWSTQDNPFYWTPEVGNTSGGQVLREGSEIVGVVETRQETLIFTDSSIYSMRFVAPPDTFSFNLMSSNVKLLSGRSAISVSGTVFYMGSDGFYSYAGNVAPLNCTVEKYVFDDINLGVSKKVFAGSNSLFNEIYWFYPSSGSTEPDRYVLFNYVENSWAIGSFDMGVFDDSTASTTVYNRMCWDDASVFGTPKSGYVLQWDDSVTPPLQKSSVMIQETGSSANSAAMDSYIETGDVEISSDDRFSLLNRIFPDIKFFDIDAGSSDPTLSIVVSGKEFPGASESAISSSSIVYSGGNYGVGSATPAGNATAIRGRGRALSVKFSSSGTTFKWRLGDTRIDMRPDGRR